MSAFLCSDTHIFELAKYFVDNCQQYASKRLKFREAAKILNDANCESLGARYGDENFEAIDIPELYRPTITNIHSMAKQVDCFSYQACEYDGWEKSQAREMCDSIKYHLLSNSPEYDNAPWGI